MSKKWGYALVALGSAAIAGALGAVGGGYFGFQRGYDKGYNESEPEILLLDREMHGIEGLCVVKNEKEMVCAADVNYDGAVDVVLMDVEKLEIKDVMYGKDDCDNKYLRRLEEL